jgi:hypothetical protein
MPASDKGRVVDGAIAASVGVFVLTIVVGLLVHAFVT